MELTEKRENFISMPIHEEMEVELDVENFDLWIPMRTQILNSNINNCGTR